MVRSLRVRSKHIGRIWESSCDGVHHALIVDMIVHPEYQGKHIGATLLTKLVQRCKDNNIRDIQLFAAADKSDFYKKGGFRLRPENAPGMEYEYPD